MNIRVKNTHPQILLRKCVCLEWATMNIYIYIYIYIIRVCVSVHLPGSISPTPYQIYSHGTFSDTTFTRADGNNGLHICQATTSLLTCFLWLGARCVWTIHVNTHSSYMWQRGQDLRAPKDMKYRHLIYTPQFLEIPFDIRP